MNTEQAWKIFKEYNAKDNPTQFEKDAFIEASEFYIYADRDTPDRDIVLFNLASFYYDNEYYPQAKKYYEILIDQYDNLSKNLAQTCLGKFYYYGHDGMPNYQKAYQYANQAAEFESNLQAQWLKLACIYQFNDSPSTDTRYTESVFQLTETVVHRQSSWFAPVPEAKLLIASIFSETKDPSIKTICEELLQEARAFLPRRLQQSKNPDDLLLMHQIIDMLPHTGQEILDIYDLIWLLKKDSAVSFTYAGAPYEVHAQQKDHHTVISFQDNWYCSIDDFLKKATIDGHVLRGIAHQISNITKR